MKKLFLLLIFLESTFHGFGQITFEHSYYIQKTQFWVTNIGNDDYKYVFEDSSGFSVYNLDHSPYLINIVPPVPLFQLPNVYEIAYLTKSLFDCDSTNIEYAVSSTNYVGNYYVFRIDGTLLFQMDSVRGPFCAGCNDGSTYLQPIFNTPDGAKLMLFDRIASTGEQDSLHVFSLCGTLPENAVYDFSSQHNSYVKIFPNPASQHLNFEIKLPDNINQYEFVIMNSNSQELTREKIEISGNKYSLDVQNYSSGTYYYYLSSNYKVFQTGKFILTK